MGAATCVVKTMKALRTRIIDALPTTIVQLLVVATLTLVLVPGLAQEDPLEARVEPESVLEESSAVSTVEIIVLGIVEGVTEYLPVSSTGHLILAQRVMGIGNSNAANAFAICIQAGAIAAVLLLYFPRVGQITRGFFGQDPSGRRVATCLVVAFLPAAAIGLCLDDWIESYLFGVKPIVAAWFVGGLLILFIVRWQQSHPPQASSCIESMTWKMALVVGLAQSLALWPGTSRSMTTILGGVLVGLSLPAAVEFSFLLGMITLGAATAYKGLEHGPIMVETYGWLNIAVGFVTAAISAAVAVKWMVHYLNRHGLAIFGYYRVLLAVVVGVLILNGVL